MTLSEAIEKVKQAGRNKVRIVPNSKDNIDGPQLIQISEGSGWSTIYEASNRRQAEAVLSQAVNRVILG